MSYSKGVRITCKRTRPNPLFQEWLEELHHEAQEKNSKLEPMLREALDSLSKYPLPLASGSECVILKGFEKKLCMFLDKRLEVYNSQLPNHVKSRNIQRNTCRNKNINHVSSTKNIELDKGIHNESNTNSLNVKKLNNKDESVIETGSVQPEINVAVHTAELNLNQEPKSKIKKGKTYKPAFRSGGYALLVGLLENRKDNPNKPALSKDNLIGIAQKYSVESFTRPKPESFYTAWSNMTRLVSKGLVVKSRGKKVEYSLTDQGFKIAEELLQEAAVTPTVNDIIFNSEPNRNSNESNDIPSINEANISNDSSIELLAGSFDIILLIDKNETGGVSKKNDPTVAQFNKYPDLKHEYRSLKVGDFTWVAQNKNNNEQELVLPYIIERKRMDDLGASIKDGRFHEQKFRLRRCGLKNVIYMVENYGKNKHVGLPVQSLMQALANTRVQDGFKVHVTDSLTDSARFLAMMTKRLTIEYKDKNLKGSDHEPSNEELMTYNFFRKSSMKTKALTVTETFIKMLLQLKGVSVEKALAITKEYSTPKSLIEEYKNYNEKDGQLLLANLKYGESRNVGPTVSKSIYHLFTSM